MADHQPHRFEKNAPGDWYTTGDCLSCGAPELEAPELLAPLTNENFDTYFVRQPTTPSEIEHACRAARVCCVNAIRYGGSDREVIDRLSNSGEYCDFIIGRDGVLRSTPPWRPDPPPPPRRRWWEFWRRDRD